MHAPEHPPRVASPALLRPLVCGLAFALAACGPALSVAEAPVGEQPKTAESTTAALVEQLADPRYVVRLEAQQRLEERGLDAFDALLAATRELDPEVSSASARLLDGLRGDWLASLPGAGVLADSPEVRVALEGYADGSIDERGDIILALARLFNDTVAGDRPARAAAALARIARFEPSERLSRAAARMLLADDEQTLDSRRAAAAADAAEQLAEAHGPGVRDAAAWLAAATTERRGGPVASQWSELAAREAGRRRPVAGETSDEREAVAATLEWRRLRASLREGEMGAAVEAADALADLTPGAAAGRLERALLWMAEAKRWEAVDRTLATHRAKLGAKRGAYLEARLLASRGETARSEEVAELALATAPDEVDAAIAAGRITAGGADRGARGLLGDELEFAGFAAWARREWLAEVEDADLMALPSLYARQRLADSYADEALWAEAASILAPLADEIDPKDNRQRYERMVGRVQAPLHRAAAVIAKRWCYEALALGEAGGALDDQEALLNKAIAADPLDADILIAMYRLKGASEQFRAATRQKIRDLADSFEATIAEEPRSGGAYNQWAWLIANTEGDQQKAVRYSRRSLELESGDGGFLDTLGRCLYAVGELDEAIARQREAIKLHPTMKVMQRQLEEFERAKAEAAR
jgi:hypothetical protein